MIAYVFADPLVAPPVPGRGNKILWVTKDASVPQFTITGQLEGSAPTTTVTLVVPAGPSIVDMPAPGCWHLDLKWGSTTDSINLRWQARWVASPEWGKEMVAMPTSFGRIRPHAAGQLAAIRRRSRGQGTPSVRKSQWPAGRQVPAIGGDFDGSSD